MIAVIAVVAITIVAVFLNRLFREAEPVYSGDYPELFSVAISSVLGMGIDIGWNFPDIMILEEDDYGRIIFEYYEGHLYPSRLIIQKVEGDYAYFYPHYNFMLRTQGTSLTQYIPDFQDEEMLVQWLEFQGELQELERAEHQRRLDGDFSSTCEELRELQELMSLILEEVPGDPGFPARLIENLKQANSWNQEMSDTNEFVRIRVVREKETGPIPPEILVEVHYEFISESNSRRSVNSVFYSMVFLRTDNYGRSIYSSLKGDTQFVILFQPDHTFDPEMGIFEITERNSYQTELRLFMEANGWDTPFISE